MFNNPLLWSGLKVNACFFTTDVVEINTWLSVLFFLPFLWLLFYAWQKSLAYCYVVGCSLTWLSCVCSDCFLHEDYEMSYKLNGCGNKKRIWGFTCFFCVLNMSFMWQIKLLSYGLWLSPLVCSSIVAN